MLTVQVVGLHDPTAAVLLDALAEEYEIRYGSREEMASAASSEFEPPDGVFLVVVDDARRTVAGGGYRRYAPDTCEIKRMWTDPTRRRQGLASLVLAALEDAARAAGYRRVILETGPEQPEAHGLYVHRGYSTTQNLGRYALATAYEKSLR